ncbi:hypothetical protein HDU96_003975 [Phlyctochytrium bullatum]|nr:hypothetical protein HDU96_003975 [Phlyctochytrium bullatum]
MSPGPAWSTCGRVSQVDAKRRDPGSVGGKGMGLKLEREGWKGREVDNTPRSPTDHCTIITYTTIFAALINVPTTQRSTAMLFRTFTVLTVLAATASSVLSAPFPSETAAAAQAQAQPAAQQQAQPAQQQAQPQPQQQQQQQKPNVDLDVLNFALTLEHLESEFYKQGLTRFSAQDFANARFPAFVREEFIQISNHESVHVTFLTDVINTMFGANRAVPRCDFNFDVALANVNNFVTFAAILERTGVSAYAGANRLLTDANVLTAGAAIATTEGRHSSFLNLVTQTLPAVGSFDTPLGIQPVISIAAPLIRSCSFRLPAAPLPTVQVFAFNNVVRVNEVVLLSFAVGNNAPPVSPQDVNANIAFGNRMAPRDAGLANYQGLMCAFVFGLSQARSPVVAVEATRVDGRRVMVPGCLVPNEIGRQQFTQVVMFAVNSDQDVGLDQNRNVVAGPATLNIRL